MKGSDLLVRALENDGIERIFGVPGEENLDVVAKVRVSKQYPRTQPIHYGNLF
jgi:acetolactate synthase-1/2/3 large subunit